MASPAEALTTVSTRPQFSQSLKVQLLRFGNAARRWAQQGQLGSSAMTDIGRHSGARI